jgi:ubiquinone/menaquinone biosynthesis C-methylase UbiE
MGFGHSSWLHRFSDACLMHGLIKRVYRKYAESFDLKGDERILDFGGGTGALARHVARRLDKGGSVTVVDESEGWIDIGRKRLRKYRNIQFIVGSHEVLLEMKKSFDVITIHFMLHEIDEDRRQSAAAALAEALKPGGVLYIREPINRHHGMPPAEIRALMLGAGLTETAATERKSLVAGRHFVGEYRKGAPLE